MRLDGLGAVGLLLPLFVFGKVTFEELDLALILIVEDVSGDTVEEPAVVGDDHGTTRELQQGVLEGAQGFDIQIVGRFIQQQHVAAGLQQLGQMQTTALTTGEFANPLLLVGTLEVEAADIGAARELVVADAQDILTVSDLFEYRLLVIHAVAELIDRGQHHGFT